MTEKILNIALIVLFSVYCVVFAVKTVLIDVVKDEKDAEWEKNKDNITTSANYIDSLTLTIDPNYER